MVESRGPYLDKLEKGWQDYSQRVRICCFSLKTDNLQAWHAFADNHSGVAIKFKSGEESSFAEPRKVTYQDSRPQITDIADQLDALFNDGKKELSKEFVKKLLLKPKVLSHQTEWRCVRLLNKEAAGQGGENTGHTLVKFSPRDLLGLYFGLETPEPVKQTLTGLAKALNPKIKIYQAELDDARFELTMTRIDKNSSPVAKSA